MTTIEIAGTLNEQAPQDVVDATENNPLKPQDVVELREFKRGCGYRKKGGTYMVAFDPQELPAEGLPFTLDICPCCSAGIKFTRGFTWIQPRLLFNDETLPERAGLIWIGGKFYPTPKHFADEAKVLGVSRRIATVPRGLVLGETMIYLAHKKAIPTEDKPKSGIFAYFKPTKLQYIVKDTDTDADLLAKQKRGIETVSVQPADAMFEA
jgi:hypothetical protein